MRDSDTAVASLAFGVLGPLEATYAGESVRLGGRQQRAVLALLVCEVGRAVSIERLVHEVWQAAPPPASVTSLQTYVFRLRRVLEPTRAHGTPAQVLVTVPGGYRLDIDPSWVDMTRFEQGVAFGDLALRRGAFAEAVTAYDSALALWRGDVLADLPDFAFVAPLRARLEELRAAAQQSQVQARLELGGHLGVLAALDALVAEHPLREDLHAQRMLALYRSGRQSDALAAYRDLHVLLDTELGINPSPPLQHLNNRILSQDPTLAWRGTDLPRAASAPQLGPSLAPATTEEKAGDQGSGGWTRRRRVRLAALTAGIAAVALLAVAASIADRDDPTEPRMQRVVPANAVSQVDGSGSVLTSVAVGANPIALAENRDRLWVVNAGNDTVSEINPSTSAVQQETSVGHDPRAVAVSGDDLWVTNFADGTVSRVDGPTGRVVDTIDVGSGPDAIAAGPAGLWVANSGDNTIQRINAVSGRPAVPITVGDGPDGLAVDDTSVWVANGRSGTVMRIDSRTGEQMTPPIRVGTGPRGLVRAGDAVWVANELSQSVTRINVATGRTDTIAVADGPTAVAALDGSIWVAAKQSGDLVRIDPDAERPHTLQLHAPVTALAVTGDHLWVASGAFAASSHRGGTLRVAAALLPGDLEGIDPAGIYERVTLHAVRSVYDGLLAYNYSTADPQILVPDLATTVPEPTDGGRTYTFDLRPGIRYSTGAEVKASDLVRGVHRALLSTSGRPDFYADIVGARACIDPPTHPTRPAPCDLSRGVVADDEDARVTFHLTAPDPLFLYKLTILVVPVPPGTPLRELSSPVPSTGPYRITGYRRHETFDLARNPYFLPWSAAAQPDGFPDRITWIHVADVPAAVAAVRRGDADLAELTPLGGDVREAGSIVDRLSITRPNRLHSSIIQGTYFAALNSSRPPFDDVRARRAVGFAVDRRRVVDLMGGPQVAVPTCQLLPPSMPAHARYCPYSTGPQHAAYRGPDLARAKQLVTASGTRGTRVVVADLVGGPQPPLNGYLARVLREIGYRTSIHHVPATQRNRRYYFSDDSDTQAEVGGWFADFPQPSNFYDLVACGSAAGYPLHYCNRRLDRRAAHADALLRTDPGTALPAWADIDRAVTDQAPLVPVSNPVNWWLYSGRVGNYQNDSRDIGPLLSQLWVR